MINRREFVKYSTVSIIGIAANPNAHLGLGSIESSLTISADIINTPVHQLVKLISGKKLSSYEIVSSYIKRIESVNHKINAVVAFRPEEALKEAKKADADLLKGDIAGALHGIPCTIKDSFDTKGIISTAGTLGRVNHIPGSDATVVARLKKAGAIILGKTNTPELTMEFFTDNLVYRKTKNPYNLAHSPGGSSGGAAAIIAAAGSPFDIGTDTGGSIRFPAHCCGVAGLKPTAGRVPRTGHIISFEGVPQLLTHVGPMARCVEDLDLLFRVITGVDGIDPHIYPVEIRDCNAIDLKNLRIACYTYNNIITCTEEIEAAVQKVINLISNAGLNIKETLPAGMEQTADLSNDLINSTDWLQRTLERCGTEITSLNWVKEAKQPSGSEYNMLIEKIDRYRSRMLLFWNDFDVLICPVSPDTAQPHDTPYEGEPYYSYTSAFNLTGWPAVVVPVELSEKGLPIGVQVVAPPWREDVALAMAAFVEREIGRLKSPLL
jgi:amidase